MIEFDICWHWVIGYWWYTELCQYWAILVL